MTREEQQRFKAKGNEEVERSGEDGPTGKAIEEEKPTAKSKAQKDGPEKKAAGKRKTEGELAAKSKSRKGGSEQPAAESEKGEEDDDAEAFSGRLTFVGRRPPKG